MTPQTDNSKTHGLFGSISNIWDRFMAWTWKDTKEKEAAHIRLTRCIIRIIYILVCEFQKDAITLWASSLTYTVILSLVPVLALGTAVLKGLGAGDQMREAAYRFIDQMDISHEAVQPEGMKDLLPGTSRQNEDRDNNAPSQGSKSLLEKHVPAGPEAGSSVAKPKTGGMVTHLRTAVDKIFDYVDKTNFATLGVFGILGLVFAVLSVMGSIEKAMNRIWQAERGRPLGRKLMDYLALMILFPVSINVGLAASTALESPKILSRLMIFFPAEWMVLLFLKILPLAIMVGVFTIFYRFLPNAKVKFVPALAGGIIGGVGWLLVQFLYVQLQIGVARYNAIYGSFATLPLFLVWIYVGWVVFLTGAEMSFAVQSWSRYQPGDDYVSPKRRLGLSYDVLLSILSDFSQRKASTREAIVQRIRVAESQVALVLNGLIKAGLVRQIEERNVAYVPRAPADKIKWKEVLEAVCGQDQLESQGGRVAELAFQAAERALSDKPLSQSLHNGIAGL